ncbi:MAG: hypothetical protein RL757_2811 [Bacteroidota bacterium]|jgi:UDP-3-O-[3-hydroxymyristoyl] N-acetylglucosamine deacetylase/3-hydroxyacyl-[acyl-carrier-protein] dehydratase
MKQRTLAQTVQLSGIGLHTGATITVNILPAEVGFGYKFQRTDLEKQPIIAADANRVTDTTRGTMLQQGDMRVRTIEHLLSALVGCGVDNALIQLDGEEIPILDGSAIQFVAAIQAAGIVEQDAQREYFDIKTPIYWKDEATGSEYHALPNDEYALTTMTDYETLGQQFAQLDSLENYASDTGGVALARTFVFVRELKMLFEAGLIRGGSLSNAVVIAERNYAAAELQSLAQRTNEVPNTDLKMGIVNEAKLRFSNEMARHKLLDVIGDLALVGMPIRGRIIATKPGHGSNVAFAKILKKMASDFQKIKDVPVVDMTKKPVMDINQITKKIPHRFPFLLVDKVMEIHENYIIAIKNVTMNEPFFVGHFPENPVMPGVLQIEAMAQTGGIFALAHTPDDEIWDTYFLKIDACKFREKVMPGDMLVFKMELLAPIRRGIVYMKGTAFVGNKIASEAELTAMIVKRG